MLVRTPPQVGNADCLEHRYCSSQASCRDINPSNIMCTDFRYSHFVFLAHQQAAGGSPQSGPGKDQCGGSSSGETDAQQGSCHTIPDTPPAPRSLSPHMVSLDAFAELERRLAAQQEQRRQKSEPP